MSAVYRAKEPFAFTDKNGVPRSVVPGDLVTSDDPNLKGREHLFERVEDAAARARAVTEDASAAPSELRSVSTIKRPRPTEPAAAAPTDKPAVGES